MQSRRRFITRTSSALAVGCVSGVFQVMAQDNRQEKMTWAMPDESTPHRCTWMAFGADEEIWEDLLEDVQGNLANVAQAIARYEPVKMLVRPEERKLAARLCGEKVELVEASLNDLWIRDTGPTFVLNAKQQLGAVDLNFNGWGEKQDYDDDATVAKFIARRAQAAHLATDIVGEGGGIEVDGAGTAIITESCFVNDNRNPEVTKNEIENELKRLLGLRKVIWLPGVRGKDITDGHTDFYARFARPGVVVAGLEMDRKSFDYDVTRKHLDILRSAVDARGQMLEVHTLESPQRTRRDLWTEDFAAGYINFYVANGAVIAPEFGDEKADAKCKELLTKLFPKRNIIQLNIDAIAAGGGGIHCATQQEPRGTTS
jgi:agmatine deiminase